MLNFPARPPCSAGCAHIKIPTIPTAHRAGPFHRRALSCHRAVFPAHTGWSTGSAANLRCHLGVAAVRIQVAAIDVRRPQAVPAGRSTPAIAAYCIPARAANGPPSWMAIPQCAPGPAWQAFSQQHARRAHQPPPINGDRHKAPAPGDSQGDPPAVAHTPALIRAGDASVSLATSHRRDLRVSLANDHVAGFRDLGAPSGQGSAPADDRRGARPRCWISPWTSALTCRSILLAAILAAAVCARSWSDHS